MPTALFFRLFLPFAAGNFLGSIYRSVNAVVAPDIIAELRLSAEDIGLLTSIFLLFYSGVQIPLGMLLDRFGARRVAASLFAIAAVATAIFAQASDFTLMLSLRAFMGLGISVAFMGALKAMVEWMPREKLPLANAFIMTTGGLGVMASTVPIQYALNFTDWRGIYVGIASATIIVVVALVFAAPERKRMPSPTDTGSLKGVIHVFTNREFLRMVPLGSAAQGVNMAMSGLWAGPWLRDVVGLSREETATVLFLMATMITVSVLLIGWTATRLARLGVPTLATACAGISGFILFETLIAANLPVSPYLLWLPYSFCATAPVLIYSVLAQTFPPELAGRVNTAYNFTTFTFAFAVQWFMGWVIDFWPPAEGGGFAPEGYRTALAIIIAIQLTAFAWLLLAPRLAGRR